MNLNRFEDQIKSGLQPAENSERVSALIDRKLIAVRHRRTVGRRFTFAFAATGCLALAMLVVPTIRAQAELRRVAGALDSVHSLILRRVAIAPDGTSRPCGVTAYLEGRWRLEMPGDDLTYFYDGTRYVLDKTTRRFVTQSGLDGPFYRNPTGIGLSSLLGDLQRWEPRKRVDISQSELRGDAVTKATIYESDSNDRMVLYANPKTDLPIEIDNESLVSGRWSPVEVATFDFQTRQSPSDFIPDLKHYPSISQEDWAATVVRELTGQELGSTPLNNGRLVIRSIDVARDGAVFVTCQAGERVADWDRGYPIDVSDNLGTKYALMKVSSRMDKEFIKNSKDGKLELCVFVPVKTSEWKPNDIVVSARLRASRKLDRHLEAIWMNRKGVSTSMSWYYDSSHPVSVVTIARKHFEKPTVESFPAYATLVESTRFDDASHYEAEEATARAAYYRSVNDVTSERYWLNETLRLAHASGGPSDATRRLEELNEQVRP